MDVSQDRDNNRKDDDRPQNGSNNSSEVMANVANDLSDLSVHTIASSSNSILATSSNNLNDLSTKWKLFNVLLLGVVFMFMFTAYQTCAMVQVLVLEGANLENKTAGNGYLSSSIVYGSFAVSNWVSAYIVELVSSKWAMLLGGSTYCIFLGLFLRPYYILLYVSSALLGFGAAVFWAGQGKFLSINSTSESMTRNTNIFWAIFQSSLIWGNLIVIFFFSNHIFIDSGTRTPLFIALTALSLVGLAGVFFLRREKAVVGVVEGEAVEEDERPLKPVEALKKCMSIMMSRDMLLLSLIILYSGIELSYWSVLVTSVGHLTYFGSDAKKLTGICGLCIGIGQITSSFIFGLFTSFRRIDKRLVLLVGFVAHVTCFFMIFLTFPSDAPIRETAGFSYFPPSKPLIFISAFLLGFGDSCLNTQIYPTLRELYYEDISSACSLFKFIQSLAAAICFAYSPYVLMEVHLSILGFLLVTGIVCFFMLEGRRLRTSGYYDL